MNIIVYRYNSICEPDYIDAFSKLGINVIEDTDGMNSTQDLKEKMEKLGGLIGETKPLFVFSINFFPFVSMLCERLGVMYVCVSVDCPVVELFSEQIRNKCNRVFLFDYMQYQDIYEENPECIFYLPLGVNVERINNTIGEPDWEALSRGEGYKYDVSFVGSLYNEKNPYDVIKGRLSAEMLKVCEDLLARQQLTEDQAILENEISTEIIDAIKVAAGNDFYTDEYAVGNMDTFVAVNAYLSKELTVRDRKKLLEVLVADNKVDLFTRSNTDNLKGNIVVHGGVKTLTEMPLVFRQSKININPTMRSIRTGLPQRIWDVLGCGGFLLTNYREELPEYLEIGKDIEVYENIAEASEKVRYYLSHEDERLQIAQNGYEKVRQQHTVLNRVIAMIRVISGQN